MTYGSASVVANQAALANSLRRNRSIFEQTLEKYRALIKAFALQDLKLVYMVLAENSSLVQSVPIATDACQNVIANSKVIVLQSSSALSPVNGNLATVFFYQNQVTQHLFA